MKIKMVNPSIDSDPGVPLEFKFKQVDTTDTLDTNNTAGYSTTDGIFYFSDLSAVTREDLRAAMQKIVDSFVAGGTTGSSRYASVKVGYDPVNQTYTFKNDDNLEVYLSAPHLAVKGLMGLTSNESLVDSSTGGYGERVLPNGKLLNQLSEQRYGTIVSYDEATRRFTISSGTTGDTSSVQIAS